MTNHPTDASTAEELAELRESVDRLSQVVEVLTSAVDELADLLQWHVNNCRRGELPEPMVVKSLPLDPTSPEWEVNRVRDKPAVSESPSVRHRANGKLFD